MNPKTSGGRSTTDYSVHGLPFRVIATKGRNSWPYVLIHGIGTSHRYLDRLHELLSEHSDVYSIDLPGFGGLPKPPSAPDVAEMAAAIAHLLDVLGLDRVTVIGHSMGVQWAVELAVIRPDLVAHVVLMGPVTDDRHRTLRAQAIALGRDVLGEPPLVNAVVFRDYLRCGPRWFLAQSRFMVPYPIEERLALVSVPVLILRGGKDPIAGMAWCRRLRAHAPRGSSVVIVPGHRHVVQFTAAPAVASAVRAFIDGRPGREPSGRPARSMR